MSRGPGRKFRVPLRCWPRHMILRRMVALQSADPLVRLRRSGEKVPAALRNAVLAMGHDAVAGLIELLEDEEAARVDSASEGWAPVHAAELLIELRATEAIEPLLRVLKSSTPDHLVQPCPCGRGKKYKKCCGAAVSE